MKNKSIFALYTSFWLIAIVFLVVLLSNVQHDATIVNYSSRIRGTTQQLIKDELQGNPNDELIYYIDNILLDLQMGKGLFEVEYNQNLAYQQQLTVIAEVWAQLKETIALHRIDPSMEETLYHLSNEHYQLSDEMVTFLESQCIEENVRFCIVFGSLMFFYMVMLLLLLFYHRKRNNRMMMRDPLTRLYNRNGFEKQATLVLQQHPNEQYCVIKFDVENFKLINTAYDYAYGDQLLIKIADALSQQEQHSQVTAHIGADNFLILCPYDADVIDEVNTFMVQQMKDMDVSRLFSEVKFRYGAYLIKDADEGIKSMITKAALAHRESRLDLLLTSSWYNQELLERITIENQCTAQMEDAIKNHEFKLYLQPQIDLSTMAIVSAESLVRWQTSDGRFICPDDFIPLFERNGLITKLDFHMLELVCLFQRKYYHNHNHYDRIAVNVSRVTLSSAQFKERFVAIVDQYKIPYEFIEIEVTESSLNRVSKTAINLLKELRDMGFVIAMDDFGSGYASLSALGSLPVQILKLDRQFLWDVDNNEKLSLIICSTVNLAHQMGLQVICEGVEHQSHVDFLRNIDCEYAQGYFFSKPIEADEYATYYQSHTCSVPRPTI